MQDAPVREAQSNGLIQTEVSLASTSVAWPRVNQPVAWLRLAVSNIFEGLSILLILAEVGVIGAAVFTRYVINRPIAGSDELATLVLVWLTFISGAVVSRRRAHLSVNIIVKLLPGRVQQWIEATVGWLMVAMLAVLAWQSVLLAQRRSDEVSQGFGYSLALLPLPLVLGAIGMIVFEGAHLRQLPRMPAAVSGIALAAAVLGVWEFGPRLGWDLTKLPPLGVLIAGFAVIVVASAPLLLALGLPSLGYLLMLGGPNLLTFPQASISGSQNFVLLAVPLFILAGAVMESGGISVRLVNLAMALVGHLRGGLAQVSVVSAIFFSGISGSAIADVIAMGSVLVPSMQKAGYSREDSVSIVSAASAMGILVPPALLMVILGAMANLSVTRLFAAGLLPAFVIAACLMLLIYGLSRRKNWPTAKRASMGDLGKAAREGLIPILTPVIIFGSIFTGVATVTEAAGLAVIYALIVGVFVYGEIKPRHLVKILLDSSVMTGVCMTVVAISSLFTLLLARQQVPDKLAAWILSVSDKQWFFIVGTILLFIIFGALVEGIPSVIILGPIFYPIAAKLGIDLIHYSIVIVGAVGIGLFLPPVGIGLFIATAMGQTTMAKVLVPFAPFLMVLLAAVVLIGFVPWFTLIVPRLLLGG